MPGDPLYDTDFYAWTQDQAAKLREVRDNRLDAANLAEEVSDLGNSQLGKVKSHLRLLLRHLLKLSLSPATWNTGSWLSEVSEHANCARDAFSPGMRQHIDLEKIWRKAREQANYSLAGYDEPQAAADLACPFTLDELIAEEFDPRAAKRTLDRAIAEHGSG
jgi:muconolactone delta-isomerase